MPNVLVAMDKFKGTATAAEVCASVCAGIQDCAGQWSIQSMPLADGGDGTVAALIDSGWESIPIETVDGHGAAITSMVARKADTAVVELADICGLAKWHGELDPWHANTVGLGLAMRTLVELGATEIFVAVGGSASTDGGLGALIGLGFEIVDDAGDLVPNGLAGLASAARIIAPPHIERLRSVRWTVLVDVVAPLFGPQGAAYRFGPQKGLADEDIAEADRLLRGWDTVLAVTNGRRVGDMLGTGAAGGVGAALVSQLDARIESGFGFVAEKLGLLSAIAHADAVVTGEGHLDETSFTGKVVGEVLRLTHLAGTPACVVVGDIDGHINPERLDRVITLMEIAGGKDAAMDDAVVHLRQAGRWVGEWLNKPGISGAVSQP